MNANKSSSCIMLFSVTTILLSVLFLSTTFISARIATDVSYGDTLPLFASFRIGASIKTHRRPMARKFHPIVGVHRSITVNEFHNVAIEDAKDAAKAALLDQGKKKTDQNSDDDEDSGQQPQPEHGNHQTIEEILSATEGLYEAKHVSAMFHVGKMGARTPWISVVRSPIQKSSPESQAKSAFVAGRIFGSPVDGKKADEIDTPNKNEFLEEVQIYFDTVPSPEGLPTSSVTKMTFLTKYSPKPVNLTLEYIWREQKTYNPEIAISVAGVVAIICVSVLSVVMFSGRDVLKRELVVKIRDE